MAMDHLLTLLQAAEDACNAAGDSTPTSATGVAPSPNVANVAPSPNVANVAPSPNVAPSATGGPSGSCVGGPSGSAVGGTSEESDNQQGSLLSPRTQAELRRAIREIFAEDGFTLTPSSTPASSIPVTPEQPSPQVAGPETPSIEAGANPRRGSAVSKGLFKPEK
jgi:hypothetical protein